MWESFVQEQSQVSFFSGSEDFDCLADRTYSRILWNTSFKVFVSTVNRVHTVYRLVRGNTTVIRSSVSTWKKNFLILTRSADPSLDRESRRSTNHCAQECECACECVLAGNVSLWLYSWVFLLPDPLYDDHKWSSINFCNMGKWNDLTSMSRGRRINFKNDDVLNLHSAIHHHDCKDYRRRGFHFVRNLLRVSQSWKYDKICCNSVFLVSLYRVQDDEIWCHTI